LVVYNYGMGGVWGVAIAATESEVVETFPELEVVLETPLWMTQDRQRQLRCDSFDVAQPSTYPDWLQTVVKERSAQP